MNRLVVRHRASRDLRQILADSAERWGIDRAERYVRDIHEDFDRLLADPAMGSTVALLHGVYRRLNRGSHAIFFTVSDSTVAIVRVLHQRRDIPKHLR